MTTPKRPYRAALAALLGALAVAAACHKPAQVPEKIPLVPVASLPGHGSIAVDVEPKEEPRMVPPEAYLKTYLQLFGGIAPLEVQKRAREGNLFDTWDDYFAALGFPDYRIDIPRGTQTNALMIATFERLGVALCDRAVEHDLGAGKAPPAPAKERVVFSFEPVKGATDIAQFTQRFDVLHKRFLGYPAALAETDRTKRFYGVYSEIVRRHSDKAAPKSRLSPENAGWAAVCYGLVRHPEFQLY